MARGDARQRLLDEAIDHIATRGVSDLSLRELAAAIGSSHRMLIHHFGGREGLLVAVVQAVEQRERDALATLTPDPGASLADVMRAWWTHISDPRFWANERLFYELYGQALQQRPGTVELLDGIVDSWLDPAAEAFAAAGVPEPRAVARLGIAVTRGLLLDLLATGDREGTDAAMEAYIRMFEARVEASRA